MTEQTKLAQEITEAIEDIRAIYERKKRPFSDVTLRQFFGAFRRIPVQYIRLVVEEMVLSPADNFNYVPEPSDVILVARRFTEEGQVTASDVVAEIVEAIDHYGVYGRYVTAGVYVVGTPDLTSVALETVRRMGGWQTLCTMQILDGVWQAQLRDHAKAILESRKNTLLVDLNSIGTGGQEKIGYKR